MNTPTAMTVNKETQLGTLSVEESMWPSEDYPGFFVRLRNGEDELATVLFEVDQTSKVPICKIHIWDPTREDPVFDLKGTADDGFRLEMY